jgi:hypothetical protein
MKEFRRKLEEILSERFGVDPGFTAQLMPLLETFARTRPSAEEWERVLGRVAAAHRGRSEELQALDESRALIRQFVGELKRMDESIQGLAAYLERLRHMLQDPNQSRTLH